MTPVAAAAWFCWVAQHEAVFVTQYRVDGGAGFWRNFDINNQTQTRDVVYLVESVFHEMLLQVSLPRHSALA